MKEQARLLGLHKQHVEALKADNIKKEIEKILAEEDDEKRLQMRLALAKKMGIDESTLPRTHKKTEEEIWLERVVLHAKQVNQQKMEAALKVEVTDIFKTISFEAKQKELGIAHRAAVCEAL